MSLLVQNFRKKANASKDKRMSAEKNFDVGYPTGYLSFDFMNGVKVSVKNEKVDFTYNSIGIVDGSMISCVGRSGCGKTTFVMQASGNIIRPFENSAIFHEDIEGGISDMRKRQLLGMTEEEFENRYICRNTGINTENFYERIKWIHDLKLEHPEDYEYDTGLYDAAGNRIFKMQPTIVILDSLAMLMPEDMADGEELAGPMGAATIARKNTQLIKRIIPMLKMVGIIFFVINHILPDPSLLPKKTQTAWLKQGERVSGGETAIYLANNFLRFDDKNKLSKDKEFGIDGIMVDILFVKSRTNNAGKAVNLVFDYAHGFDPELSLFLLLSNQGRIHGSGIGMYLQERNDIKFSKKTFKTKLRENPEFQEIFYNECLEALEELINKTSVDVLEEKEYNLDTTSVMLKMMRDRQAA